MSKLRTIMSISCIILKEHALETQKLLDSLTIIEATLKDYPLIQNLARFYVYDLSRECGFISDYWAVPASGLYESFDFKHYIVEPSRKAYLVKIQDEIAGFILLHQEGFYSKTNWVMGEFFILAKFQNIGIGQLAARNIWERHEGLWEVSVIPENQSALSFWRKTISSFAKEQYIEEINEVDFDLDQPKRYFFHFDTQTHNQPVSSTQSLSNNQITIEDDIDEAIQQRMQDDLKSYEARHGVDVNYRRFSLVMKNEHHQTIGVIQAYTAFAEIYVDDIWVDSQYRHQGYGRQMLMALEDHFTGQGFNNINLCTSAFQAPEFYKKCGYHEEFTRTNQQHPKLSKSFFVKFFDDTVQTQGLLKP